MCFCLKEKEDRPEFQEFLFLSRATTENELRVRAQFLCCSSLFGSRRVGPLKAIKRNKRVFL